MNASEAASFKDTFFYPTCLLMEYLRRCKEWLFPPQKKEDYHPQFTPEEFLILLAWVSYYLVIWRAFFVGVKEKKINSKKLS